MDLNASSPAVTILYTAFTGSPDEQTTLKQGKMNFDLLCLLVSTLHERNCLMLEG